MCAKGFAKEAAAKSPLHFLDSQWQLPPYYLLTFELFQGDDLTMEVQKKLVTFLEFPFAIPTGLGVLKTCYLLGISLCNSKGTWRLGT
jgi:hypothetical protein